MKTKFQLEKLPTIYIYLPFVLDWALKLGPAAFPSLVSKSWAQRILLPHPPE
jgi:hypothetical protein